MLFSDDCISCVFISSKIVYRVCFIKQLYPFGLSAGLRDAGVQLLSSIHITLLAVDQESNSSLVSFCAAWKLPNTVSRSIMSDAHIINYL